MIATQAKTQQLTPPKIKRWQHVAIFFVACAVIISRRPDSLFHAQFFGEDGAIWLAQAYNWGTWKVLFWTYNGYIQIFPRLAAGTALLAPLSFAPLVENLIAIALQALPVNLLLSSRSSRWGTLRFRSVLVLLYLFLPNTREMIGTITESQWILALCAFILTVAATPVSKFAKSIDITIYSLCSFTGPFCIFFLPIAAISFMRTKGTFQRLTALIFLAGSVVQISALAMHDSSRYHTMLGAGPKLFIQILSGQIYLGTLMGTNILATLLPFGVLLFVAIIGSLVFMAASYRSPIMRRFIYLSAILFIASLAHPITFQVPGVPAWQILAKSAGIHYWFFPTLAFAWSIAWCLQSRQQILQIVAGFLAFFMVIGIVRDFRYPAFTDAQFEDYASRFSALGEGATITIPQNPPGWKLILHKR